MSSPTTVSEETGLDVSLRRLISAHGYDTVQDHLNALIQSREEEQRTKQKREADPRYLLTLPREEQDRLISAAVEKALPYYTADLLLPESERELTMDLETREFFDYEETEPDHA